MCAHGHKQRRTIKEEENEEMTQEHRSNSYILKEAVQQDGGETRQSIWGSLINRLVLTQDKAQLTWRSLAVRAALQPTVSKSTERKTQRRENSEAWRCANRWWLLQRALKAAFTSLPCFGNNDQIWLWTFTCYNNETYTCYLLVLSVTTYPHNTTL